MKKLIDKDATLEAIENRAELDPASVNHNWIEGMRDAADVVACMPEETGKQPEITPGVLTKILQEIIYSVEFREKMKNVHNCNDCGAPKGCLYRPAWGQPVIWNCPHWKEKGGEEITRPLSERETNRWIKRSEETWECSECG